MILSLHFTPFPADVANKRHQAQRQSPIFATTGKAEVNSLSDLMTPFIDLGCFY
jgi:hypothetical protein